MTALKNQSLRNAATKKLPTKVDVLFHEIITDMGQSNVLLHIERLFESWIISLDNGFVWKGNWIIFNIYRQIKQAFTHKDHTRLNIIFFFTDNECEILGAIEILYECHLANVDDNDFIYGTNLQLHKLCKQLKQIISLLAVQNNV